MALFSVSELLLTWDVGGQIMFADREREKRLQRFALEASATPEPKCREIEAQIPWRWKDELDTGIFVGLATASELLPQDSEQGTGRLRERAAVAAARVLWQREVALSQTAPPDSPEAMAGTKALFTGIESGRIKGIPVEEVLLEMEEMLRNISNRKPPNGSTSN